MLNMDSVNNKSVEIHSFVLIMLIKKLPRVSKILAFFFAKT